MFETSDKLAIEVGDRVAAVNDGKVMKGRVAETVADVAIGVTFVKGGDVVMYDRKDVMLLYRTVKTPKGTGVIPFVLAPAAKL